MAHFHIENLGAYNGDHEINLESFTNRELHTIKKLSGVRAGQLTEAFEQGDNDLIVAMVVIALERNGHKPVNVDAIWDAPVGAVTMVADEEDEAEGDAGPPSQDVSESENTDSSGEPSRLVSAVPANGPSPTGRPVSFPSDRVTSAT